MSSSSVSRRERVLVAVAWPYAAGLRHIGHAAAYVPADVFARYHRLRGNDVLMVSGTDEHGTPVMVVADSEGVSPREARTSTTQLTRDDLRNLGISYDLFTRTTTGNHARVVRDLFRTLHEHGFIFEQIDARRVLQPHRQHAARPLHRGNLPDLRIHARTRRPVRQLRQPARPDRPDRTALEDRRHDARIPRDEPPVPRPARVLASSSSNGSSRRSTGGRTSGTSPSSSRARSSRGRSRATSTGASAFRCRATRKTRTSGSTCGSTPSSATSRPRSNGRSRAATPDAWRDWWQDPEARARVLHGQGQHRLPHDHLAGGADRIRRGRRARGRPPADASGQRRRVRVPDHGAPAVQRKPGRRHLRPGLSRALRRGRAPLLPDRCRARDARHRFHLGRVRPPEQRRARRDVGEPGQPHADEHVPQLRSGSASRAS